MIRTITFILYAFIYIFLYKFARDYSLQKAVTGVEEPWGNSKPLSVLINTSVALGIPWFLIIFAGISWGYTEQPYASLRMSLSSDLSLILIIAIGVSLALSYVVLYQIGYMKGYRDGRS